jgi:hypothetical protein
VKNRLRWMAAVLVVGCALILLGRWTAPDPHDGAATARSDGYSDGYSAGYADGLRAGQAQGREEGRALQAGSTLPADAQAAFTTGYTAGANDAFTGYDGGWGLDEPYVVVLEHGAGPITYRIGARTTIAAGVDYYLCTDGRTICQQPRR